jgi:uncharacterized protein YecE (DUF72 family)
MSLTPSRVGTRHEAGPHRLLRLPGGRHCFEFREPSWFAPEVYELLREHGVALVIGDRPEVASFQTREMTTD